MGLFLKVRFFKQAAFNLHKVSNENEFAELVCHKHYMSTVVDVTVLGDHLALREKEVAAFTQGLAFTLVSHLALLRVSCL